MFKTATIIFFLSILPGSCNEKETTETKHISKSSFVYFEISYRGGETKSLTFRVDSNKIFIAPPFWAQMMDSIKYGLLPDTIFNMIDNTLQRIQTDTTIKSSYNNCFHCELLSIRAFTGNDSIKLFQSGEISEPVYKLIHELMLFLKAKSHNHFAAFMVLETAKEIAPPLPPAIEPH